MTFYKFKFRCSQCDDDSEMKYMVPELELHEIDSSVLSCKLCERPLLKIWCRVTLKSNEPVCRYAIKDLMNRRWIIGGEGKKEDVSRDSFLAWVVDHRGERIG